MKKKSRPCLKGKLQARLTIRLLKSASRMIDLRSRVEELSKSVALVFFAFRKTCRPRGSGGLKQTHFSMGLAECALASTSQYEPEYSMLLRLLSSIGLTGSHMEFFRASFVNRSSPFM